MATFLPFNAFYTLHCFEWKIDVQKWKWEKKNFCPLPPPRLYSNVCRAYYALNGGQPCKNFICWRRKHDKVSSICSRKYIFEIFRNKKKTKKKIPFCTDTHTQNDCILSSTHHDYQMLFASIFTFHIPHLVISVLSSASPIGLRPSQLFIDIFVVYRRFSLLSVSPPPLRLMPHTTERKEQNIVVAVIVSRKTSYTHTQQRLLADMPAIKHVRQHLAHNVVVVVFAHSKFL